LYTRLLIQAAHIAHVGLSWSWSYGSWIYNYLFTKAVSSYLALLLNGMIWKMIV